MRGKQEAALQTALTWNEAASSALTEGAYEAARKLAAKALRKVERLEAVWPGEVSGITLTLARARLAAGDTREANALGARAVALLQRLQGGLEIARLRLQVHTHLAQSARIEGRYDEARSGLRRAMRDARRTLSPTDWTVGVAYNELGVICKYMGRFDESQRAYERALPIVKRSFGATSSHAASLYHNLGGLAHSRGRFDEAVGPARRAVEIRRKLLGANHPAVAITSAALAAILLERGQVREAEALYRGAVTVLKRKLGSSHPDVAFQLCNLGALLHRSGRLAQAERRYRQALAAQEGSSSPMPFIRALILSNLAALQQQRGEYASALPLSRDAKQLFRSAVGADHPNTKTCVENHRELMKAMKAKRSELPPAIRTRKRSP